MNLVELIIAIALSLFVGVKLLTGYLTAREQLTYQQAFAWRMEHARDAQHLLSHAIREAGYIGCPKLTQAFSQYIYAPHKPITLNNSLLGFTADTIPMPDPMLERLRHRIKKGTEGVFIRKMHAHRVSLAQEMTTRDRLVLNATPKLAAGTIVMISNCLQADVFQIKRVQAMGLHQIIIPETSLKHIYTLPAEVAEMSEEAFYTADTGRLTDRGKPIEALYHFDFRGIGHEEELVEGIDKMRFYYASLHNNRLVYLPTAQTNRWDSVYAIQVVLQLDRIEDREWEFYVQLRERSLP